MFVFQYIGKEVVLFRHNTAFRNISGLKTSSRLCQSVNTLWESKNCEGLNKHTHAYLLSPTSPHTSLFPPHFSFSLPLPMTKVAFQSISGRDSVQGEGFHLIHSRDTGWQVLHVKSREGFPSVGITNACAFHRQTERRSICEESWVMCMWGKRQHSVVPMCVRRGIYFICVNHH